MLHTIRNIIVRKISFNYAGISKSREPCGIDRGVRVRRCDSNVAGEISHQTFTNLIKH